MNKKQQPFFNPELSGFCSQMAMILHSGISPLEGITIMLEDSTSDREKDILQQILDTLQETADFSLFEKRPCLLSYHRNEWDTTFGKCKKGNPKDFCSSGFPFCIFLQLSVFVKIYQASCFYNLLFIFCHILAHKILL